jgi:hypothetical protein
MMSPLLFAVYVAAFVAVLYAVEHFVSAHWLTSLDRDADRSVQRSRSDGKGR